MDIQEFCAAHAPQQILSKQVDIEIEIDRVQYTLEAIQTCKYGCLDQWTQSIHPSIPMDGWVNEPKVMHGWKNWRMNKIFQSFHVTIVATTAGLNFDHSQNTPSHANKLRNVLAPRCWSPLPPPPSLHLLLLISSTWKQLRTTIFRNTWSLWDHLRPCVKTAIRVALAKYLRICTTCEKTQHPNWFQHRILTILDAAPRIISKQYLSPNQQTWYMRARQQDACCQTGFAQKNNKRMYIANVLFLTLAP